MSKSMTLGICIAVSVVSILISAPAYSMILIEEGFEAPAWIEGEYTPGMWNTGSTTGTFWIRANSGADGAISPRTGDWFAYNPVFSDSNTWNFLMSPEISLSDCDPDTDSVNITFFYAGVPDTFGIEDSPPVLNVLASLVECPATDCEFPEIASIPGADLISPWQEFSIDVASADIGWESVDNLWIIFAWDAWSDGAVAIDDVTISCGAPTGGDDADDDTAGETDKSSTSDDDDDGSCG
jgi:hypothetical protein